MIALCGQGAGCEGNLDYLNTLGQKMQVFTHEQTDAGQRLFNKARLLGVPATFASINDRSAWAYGLAPSLIVSVGYLTIVTAETLETSPGINCHYSLLPRHRGRSPVPWAIAQGDSVTGVSWHWMTPGIDEGDLLLQMACQIEMHETQATLFNKLHWLAIETAPAAIRLARGGWPGVSQQGRASYHRAGPPHNGEIDPIWSDEYLERFIRAMTMPPLPYARFNGEEIRTIEEFYHLTSRMERTGNYVF